MTNSRKILGVALSLFFLQWGVSEAAGAPHEMGHPVDARYQHYGNTVQGVPSMIAGIISLYKGDFQGFSTLIALSNFRSASKMDMKDMVNKDRPCGCKGGSFPSGHSLVSFQGASFVHYRYGFWYALPLYMIAGSVGYSRVKLKAHDWVDVAGSALIANLTTWLFTPEFGTESQFQPVMHMADEGMQFGLRVRL